MRSSGLARDFSQLSDGSLQLTAHQQRASDDYSALMRGQMIADPLCESASLRVSDSEPFRSPAANIAAYDCRWSTWLSRHQSPKSRARRAASAKYGAAASASYRTTQPLATSARINNAWSPLSRAVVKAPWIAPRSGTSSEPYQESRSALSASALTRAAAESASRVPSAARAASIQANPSRMRPCPSHIDCKNEAISNAIVTSLFSRLQTSAARRLSISRNACATRSSWPLVAGASSKAADAV